MTNFISRIGKNKAYLKIELMLHELESTKGEVISNDFFIQWKRGPQTEPSASYNFESGKIVVMSDKFERVSGFYQTKKEWSKKECIFQLMTMKKDKLKVVTETKVNMAEMIGSILAKKEVDMGKGYILKTQWNILPACPKLHAQLFKGLEAENQLAEAEGLIRRESSQLDLDSTKDSEGFIKEMSDLVDENTRLKAQLNAGPSDMPPKVENQMSYLVNLLADKDAEVQKLQSQSAKKDKEMQYLIELLKTQAHKSISVEEKSKKYMQELTYMGDLLKRSEAKFEAELQKSSKMLKEIQYLTDLLAKSEAKEAPPAKTASAQQPSGGNEVKLMAQIAYLADLLEKAEAKYSNAQTKPSNEVKMMKQIAYLTELLSQSESKAAPPSEDREKLVKEIDYLT